MGIDYKEIYEFTDELKARDIPVIFEYDINADQPRSMYYKPPKCVWTGILFLTDDESLHPNQKYCELTLYEKAGIICLVVYDKCLYKDVYWEKLDINELDQYAHDTMETANSFYEAARADIMGNERKIYPSFAYETDILLKDCYMKIYLKQQESLGVKFIMSSKSI